MFAILLLTLILGIITGLILAVVMALWLIKAKCPQCKKLKPLWEIVVFYSNIRTISGKWCRKCQRPKPQINIE